jgi:hypothetical protein
VIESLDAAIGPVKQRNRGFGAGELLTGLAAAQLVPYQATFARSMMRRRRGSAVWRFRQAM